MFLEQVFHYRHEFWRYIVVSLITIVASLLFQIPFTIAVVLKSDPDALMNGSPDLNMLAVLEPNLNLFLILLSFALTLPIFFMLVKAIHGQGIRSLTTIRKQIDWKRFLFSFLLWGFVVVAVTSMGIYLHPENYQWNFQLGPFLIMIMIGVLMIPLQTSLEEYVFRGYLMQGMGALFRNRWAPLILTSLIFGCLHLANPEIQKIGYEALAIYITIGLFLGIITLMDQGMELALGFHAANNMVAAFLVSADWTAFQTHSLYKDIGEPEFIWQEFGVYLIFLCIMLLVFAKKYRWGSWKKGLFGAVSPPDEGANKETTNASSLN